MLCDIQAQARSAIAGLLEQSALKSGDIVAVGCSSSEIMGARIGKNSNYETAETVFAGIYPALKQAGVYLAAQCCEHLNRALVVERACAERYGLTIVSAVPQPKAGGSFATAAYRAFEDPVLAETIAANAGLDIGDTLIGMHLKRVAVPVRLDVDKIGEANVVAAKTRPPYIGGSRAVYE